MVRNILTLSAAILSAVVLARADGPVPDTPSPGATYNTGAQCAIAWSADTTGAWKEMAIELMTGDNFNMVHLTTVTTIDATTATTFSWTCPSVTLNAPIYFYQFSAAGQNLTWTGRFTIASSSGASVAAPNALQPNGDAKPWGTGALSDPSTAVAAPSWLSSTASGSVSPSASASASVTAGTNATSSAAGTTTAGASSSVASTVASASAARSSSASAAAPVNSSAVAASSSNTTTTSAALGRADMAGVLARSGAALAGVAGVFALAL